MLARRKALGHLSVKRLLQRTSSDARRCHCGPSKFSHAVQQTLKPFSTSLQTWEAVHSDGLGSRDIMSSCTSSGSSVKARVWPGRGVFFRFSFEFFRFFFLPGFSFPSCSSWLLCGLHGNPPFSSSRLSLSFFSFFLLPFSWSLLFLFPPGAFPLSALPFLPFLAADSPYSHCVSSSACPP